MNDRVSIDIQGGVADVRLVRADKMNALDDAMFEALIRTGERLKGEKGLRAVVLSGEGRAFCAGLDTSSFAAMASGGWSGGRSGSAGALATPRRTPGGSNRAQHAVMVWREIPVPVIAAVHGVAYGGGYQLQLSADLRFVARDARLSVFEIRWGLIPDMAGMALLRGLVRDDVARDLTYSGRIFSGEEALAMGLATRVCDDPRAEALEYARDVAAKNPHAVRAAKRLLNLMQDGDQQEILLEESREQGALIGSPNQVEAVMANMQKRAADFAEAEAETPPPLPFGAYPHDATPIAERRISINGKDSAFGDALAWAGLATFPNLPSTVVPVGESGGLPCGMQVIGAAWRDLDCIATAGAIGALMDR